MSDGVPYLVGMLIVVGALFTLTASIGLLRLPDLYTRMHAASKSGTVGSCVMLLALAIDAADWSISTRAIAGIVFFLLTVPISSHLLAKAAHAAGYKQSDCSVRDDLALDNSATSGQTQEWPAKQNQTEGQN